MALGFNPHGRTWSRYFAAKRLLQQPGARLMHQQARYSGGYFIGDVRIDRDVALRLIKHPAVEPDDVGLFPGMAQSWQFVGDNNGRRKS
jgi:hypothetical protein